MFEHSGFEWNKVIGRVFAILISLVALLCSACHTEPSAYDFHQDVSLVEKIELARKTVDNGQTDDPVAVLLTLEQEACAAILEKIQSAPVRQYWNDPGTSVGEYQFRIYYQDGEIEIIGKINNAYIMPDGSLKRGRVFFEGDSFNQLFFEILENLNESST